MIVSISSYNMHGDYLLEFDDVDNIMDVADEIKDAIINLLSKLGHSEVVVSRPYSSGPTRVVFTDVKEDYSD